MKLSENMDRSSWIKVGVYSLAISLLFMVAAASRFDNQALTQGRTMARSLVAGYASHEQTVKQISLDNDDPTINAWVGPLVEMAKLLPGLIEKPEIKTSLIDGEASVSMHPEGSFSLYIVAASLHPLASSQNTDNPLIARVVLNFTGYGNYLLLVFLSSFVCSLVFSLILAYSLHHRSTHQLKTQEAGFSLQMNQRQADIKEQLERTRNQLNSLQLMLGSMNEGVLVIDTRGRIRLINPMAKNFFNLSEIADEQILQSPLLERIHASELSVLFEAILGNHNAAEMELILYRQPICTLHISASWITSNQASEQGVLFVITDISTLKHLESVRTEFVANVSHELRTPVTALKGFAETLLDSPLDDPETERHFLGIILRQAERLMAIIEDLLMLSRLEQSGGTVPKESVSLSELMEAALEVCRPSANAKDSQIVCEFREMTLTANRHLLEQAVINLVENAIKYSPQASLIRISADHLQSPKSWNIVVCDNGPGIPLRDQDHLFERFYRIDKARSRTMGGTGLGLAIVRHIALAHGGSVSLESTIGKGSCFTLHLPDFS